MKAMILAAGLGSRLGQLTRDKPKALVEVGGQTLLERLILSLKETGYDEFLINTYHFADQVIHFLKEHSDFGLKILISDERPTLLDTGGAIWNARSFFSGKEPILVHNVDVVSAIDLRQFREEHIETQALVSLCIRDRKTNRKLLFDEEMRLTGWQNISSGQYKWVHEETIDHNSYAYSGIYYADPAFAKQIKLRGSFSIIDAWLDMAATYKLRGILDPSDHWYDLGTPERIAQAEKYLETIK